MIIKKFKAVLLVTVLCVIAALGFYYTQRQSSKTETPNNTEEPLSALTAIKLTADCNLYVLINPDSVWIEPFENVCSNGKSFSIEKNQYPKLFQQGVVNSSFISIEKTSDPDLILIVSNNQPDHGGYSPTYQLKVNPKTGEIKEF